MAFNHDNFVASANYGDLNTLLQWYMDTVGPHRPTLRKMADQAPGQLKALYANDPVLRKLRKITDEFGELMGIMP